MKILQVAVKNFGCLQQKEFTLRDGLNIMYGTNESGKTTLHTFIKSMFFGMRRQRGRAARTDSYSRYEPWENSGYYGGSIRFACGGRKFRLDRGFQKERAGAALVCETDGEQLSIGDGDLKMLLGGISESIYDNTVSIGQLRAGTGQELAMELKNYMANCQDSGDGELNLERTFAILKKEKKELSGQLLNEQQEYQRRGEHLQEQILHQEEELKRLETNLEQNQAGMDRARENAEQGAAVGGMSAVWNIGMLLVAFGAGIALAFLEGWLRVVPVLLGLAAEGVLLYFRSRRMKTLRRMRRKEHQKKDSRARELERLGFIREHLLEEIAEKRTLLENLRSEQEEYYNEKPSYQGLPEKLKALDLAVSTIDRISGEMQGRIGNRLRKRTSEIFREITEGKYHQVLLDEDFRISVDTGEHLIPLEQLSRGTMEQLYFSLRMAASEILCQEESLPLLLDDVFVMYDEKRLAQTLKWLAKCGKQVLLCTCHTREAKLLRQMGLPFHEIRL